MSEPKWMHTAQRGFFSHDEDPESWDFRATTQPNLGLIPRAYPTDNDFDPSGERSAWERFEHYLRYLNLESPTNRCYKLFYLVRHGEGVHNVKEKEVGREEWNRHWAKLPGDTSTTWADADLTSFGVQQANTLADYWTESCIINDIPAPGKIYSSPLRRCLHTTDLAFGPVLSRRHKFSPTIKEGLRERLGVHTCDERSSKSWIAEAYPTFTIDANFPENDSLWKPDRRETFEEHVARSKELLGDIFENDTEVFIAMVAHSGTIMSLFAATGWKRVPVAAGEAYPLLVLAEKG